jgi:indolepyruvate ferredoxin oxidoreductase beta subunit
MRFDIFFAGVGGQGILTIGEILAEVAHYTDFPANFYPSKGMAQRGGFVKAQLRLGRESVGPNISQRGADMVIAMEQSESLKAIRAPTAVSLGKASYPTLAQITEQVKLAGARLVYIDPMDLPKFAGEPVRPNLYVLGVIMGQTTLGSLISSADVEHIIQTRFKKNTTEANLFAYRAGLGILQGIS